MNDSTDQDDAIRSTADGLPPVSAAPAPASTQPENLVRALENFIITVISDQLTAMLDGADEVLFDMAEKASSESDQRLYFDALRVLRVERARLLRSFQDNLQHTFADGRNERAASNIDLDDMESWSIQGAEDTEETVTIANLESKATSLYQKEMAELENRLDNFAGKSGDTVKISPKLAAPGKIFDAFRHTVKGLEVEFPIKQVIYRLAERSLVSNLGQVYVGANQMLAERGYTPVRRAAGSAPTTVRTLASSASPTAVIGDIAPAADAPTSASTTTSWPRGLSTSRVLEGLRPHKSAGFSASQGFTDSELASEMGSLLDAMAEGRPHASSLPAANLALSGQMFDSLYQDRSLPEPLRPLLRRLQYPVMKTSLADAAFFTNARHPVRKLVHEVYDLLSGTDHPTAQDIERLSDLIDYLLSQFEIAPQRLAKPEERAPLVSDEHAASFLADQKQRIEEHRTRALEKIRRLVAQEIKLRTAAHNVPEALMPLLLSGFAPLLAVNALRGGIDGIAWNDSLALLERVLISIAPRLNADVHQSAEEADIVTRVTEKLVGIGLSHDKVQRLVTVLLDLYQTRALDQAAQPPSDTPPVAPSAAQLSAIQAAQAADNARQALSAILVTGSWFQVWDPSSQQRRWLKLGSYMAERDAVIFDDFLGENRLRIAASALIRDLIAGRSAPVDPNPTVQRSLGLLAPLADLLPESQNAALWQPASLATH